MINRLSILFCKMNSRMKGQEMNLILDLITNCNFIHKFIDNYINKYINNEKSSIIININRITLFLEKEKILKRIVFIKIT